MITKSIKKIYNFLYSSPEVNVQKETAKKIETVPESQELHKEHCGSIETDYDMSFVKHHECLQAYIEPRYAFKGKEYFINRGLFTSRTAFDYRTFLLNQTSQI